MTTARFDADERAVIVSVGDAIRFNQFLGDPKDRLNQLEIPETG